MSRSVRDPDYRRDRVTVRILEPHTEALFWAKVDKTDTCWLWTASRHNAGGYGRFHAKKIGTEKHAVHLAHRLAYELLVGEIPDGYRIDHRCHVTHCVNPEHLRPVTIKQNAENMLGASRASKSGVRGVHWSSAARRWTGQVTHQGIRYGIGKHRDIEDAEAAIVALRNQLFTHNDIDRGRIVAHASEQGGCEAQQRITKALYEMEVGWGSGTFDYGKIKQILTGVAITHNQTGGAHRCPCTGQPQQEAA